MNPEHEERIRDFIRNMTGHPDRGDIALLLAEIDVLREALKESVVLQFDSIQTMDQLEKELDEQKGMVRDFWAREKKNRETMRRLENLEKAVGVAFSLDVESSPTQSRYNKLGVRADHIEMGDNKPRSDHYLYYTCVEPFCKVEFAIPYSEDWTGHPFCPVCQCATEENP